MCRCRGASGFVQLAQNQETWERVAIKYVSRLALCNCKCDHPRPHMIVTSESTHKFVQAAQAVWATHWLRSCWC